MSPAVGSRRTVSLEDGSEFLIRDGDGDVHRVLVYWSVGAPDATIANVKWCEEDRVAAMAETPAYVRKPGTKGAAA